MATQVVAISSAGNNVVIEAPENKGIVVRQLVLQANALVTVTFKAGSTALSGPMQFPTGGGLVVGDNGSTIWDIGHEDFVINLAAGLIINIGGWIVYDLYDI